MAGGGFAVADAPSADYGGRVTFSVVVTCLMAASGGLIFGYDIGISGGVTAMESFLGGFFPGVLRRMASARRDEYCVYDSHALTAFTSSLYLAGLAASILATRVTRAIGRQAVMLAGGALFFAGASVNAAAVNVAMLIVGRMLLGFGVGFTNQGRNMSSHAPKMEASVEESRVVHSSVQEHETKLTATFLNYDRARYFFE